MTKNSAICIISGDELRRNGNGNGSKERKKDAILADGLCDLRHISQKLESFSECDPNIISEIESAIEIINGIRRDIRTINESNGDSNGGKYYSAHHPIKRAIWGYNEFTLPMRFDLHAQLENENILRAESMILKQRLDVYAAINAQFILNGGKNLSKKQIAEIIFQSEMQTRKIPEKTFRRKLCWGNHDPVTKMKNMLTAFGVMISDDESNE